MTPQLQSPLEAPIWRKLLALRVLLVAILVVVASLAMVSWFDYAKPDVPRWLEKAFLFLAVLPFLTFITLLVRGAGDVVVHFVPEGKLKKFLLSSEKPSAILAKEFSESAYMYALLPFIVWAGLAALLIGLLLIFGSVGLVGSLLSSLFGGWPSWAIVITILLVLILLKK